MTDHEALDRFVCENDDLTELETRIGRFNIFDALGVADAEIRHSNFLAWLLDPAESHGQGPTFLRSVLMDLLRQLDPSLRPLSPIMLEGEALSDVEVRREWRNIDLLIVSRQLDIVVAVENKVRSSERSGQLRRYREIVAREFPSVRPMFVYLTVDRDEPSDDAWTPYGYGDLHRVLTRTADANATAMNDDVRAFVGHYLRLIGSRFMNDEKIDELCDRIYRNHRQALELIFDRVKDAGRGLLRAIADEVEDGGQWRVFNITGKNVQFQPKAWPDMLPPIGKRSRFEPHTWIFGQFSCGRTRSNFSAVVSPTTDPVLRRAVVERLTQNREEFGLRLFRDKSAGTQWTRICTEEVARWNEEEGPDEEAVLAAVRHKLDKLAPRFERMTAALQEVVATA